MEEKDDRKTREMNLNKLNDELIEDIKNMEGKKNQMIIAEQILKRLQSLRSIPETEEEITK